MKITFLNSLRVRIVIILILLISVPFAILQFSNTRLVYDKLQSKTIYTSEALARSIATNVKAFMNGSYHAAQLLAENRDVLEGTQKGAAQLKEAVSEMQDFKLFYVQDMNGKQVIRSNGDLADRSDRWWFRKMQADPSPFVSDAYISVNNNELVTSIFLPMYYNHELSGVFGADLTLDTIQSATGQYWNKDITYIVMDSKGSVLAGTDLKRGEYINYLECTRRTVVLDKNNHYQLDAQGQILTKVEKIKLSETMKKVISNALKAKTKSFQFRDKQSIVVCAYQPITMPGNSEAWSVIVFQKQTDYISMILLWIIFACLIFLCIFITIRVINKSVIDPVLKIQQDMEQIKSGTLDTVVQVTQKNEIGVLAADINSMLGSLKLHQQRLHEDEKMAALGQLVAGVAHEINTPLGIGVTTSTYMQKVNQDCRHSLVAGNFTKQDLLDYMQTMNESLELLQFNLERGSNIIQSFKKIAVDQTTENLETFQLAQYIHGIVLSLIHEYKNSGHTIEVDCDEELVITSYPGVFAQILTNFIMNSLIHAFHDTEHGKISIHAYKEDMHLILRYADNGCGIRAEYQSLLFTPFYTTNKGGGGSGLGLSIVYNLVTKKLNGEISVNSEEGKGVEFFITIPV